MPNISAALDLKSGTSIPLPFKVDRTILLCLKYLRKDKTAGNHRFNIFDNILSIKQ